MILKNTTTGKIICKDLKVCESFIDRMFGLLIKSNPRNLLFKTCFGIHTFFLKEPIDVLVLDKQMKIVKVKRGLEPNRLFFWNPRHNLVIELKASLGVNYAVGDILSMKDTETTQSGKVLTPQEILEKRNFQKRLKAGMPKFFYSQEEISRAQIQQLRRVASKK